MCKRDGITEKQTNRQIIHLLDAPVGTFRLGYKNRTFSIKNLNNFNAFSAFNTITKMEASQGNC